MANTKENKHPYYLTIPLTADLLAQLEDYRSQWDCTRAQAGREVLNHGFAALADDSADRELAEVTHIIETARKAGASRAAAAREAIAALGLANREIKVTQLVEAE